jgi:ribonuclease E
MATTTDHLTEAPVASDDLVAAAQRASDWAGEPFLHADEEPEQTLAPGTARRRALDDALAEIERGNQKPSSQWKVKYGLMLGLERVLSEERPKLAAGKTELRRHQVDALAGMLTELIHAAQRENGNGNGTAVLEEAPDHVEEEPEDELGLAAGLDETEEDVYEGPDPGAARRFRFRHPTASGKTIAAAGFVEAARTLGVLILTHRRLLVQQFTRDLTDEGYAERFAPAIERDQRPPQENPITIQTYAWFARHVNEISRDAYHLVICDEAHTALGEKTSAAIRSFPEPMYIGMTATEQLLA